MLSGWGDPLSPTASSSAPQAPASFAPPARKALRLAGFDSHRKHKRKVAKPSGKASFYLKIPLVQMIYLQGVPNAARTRGLTHLTASLPRRISYSGRRAAARPCHPRGCGSEPRGHGTLHAEGLLPTLPLPTGVFFFFPSPTQRDTDIDFSQGNVEGHQTPCPMPFPASLCRCPPARAQPLGSFTGVSLPVSAGKGNK